VPELQREAISGPRVAELVVAAELQRAAELEVVAEPLRAVEQAGAVDAPEVAEERVRAEVAAEAAHLSQTRTRSRSSLRSIRT
jgi:hypothetical protein